jgi:hypothetical protein
MVRIWLDRAFVGELERMRGQGETYSDVILKHEERGFANADDLGPLLEPIIGRQRSARLTHWEPFRGK